MACDIKRQKAVVMRVGCQEKRSDPGTAVYTMKAVMAPVMRWNTMVSP